MPRDYRKPIVRVLIVDDEFLARACLTRLCAMHPDVQVVGEAESGGRAIELIRSRQPDLLLLDVELVDMSGFDVVSRAAPAGGPLVIVVTAHPEYASRAYEIAATDCLTKPVHPERFAVAMARARERRSVANFARPDAVGAQPLSLRLIGEKSRRLYFIEACDVDYVESDANYVVFHVGESGYLARNSIKHLNRVLGPLGFWRIERSLMVNMSRVEFAERLGNGRIVFTLRGGRRLVSSMSYRASILRELRRGRVLGLTGAG